MTARYTLRSGPVVALACLAGALAGAQLGGGALMLGGALARGQPLDQQYTGGVPELIYALVFWDMFQLPGPLFGLMVVAWPILTTIQAKRPDRVHPWLAYALCLGGMVIGGWLPLIPALLAGGAPQIPPASVPASLLSSAGLSAALGLPAALVFRMIALKKAPQAAPLPRASFETPAGAGSSG
jgi:hypothetical protein